MVNHDTKHANLWIKWLPSLIIQNKNRNKNKHKNNKKQTNKQTNDSLTRETRLRYTWRIPPVFDVESLYPELRKPSWSLALFLIKEFFIIFVPPKYLSELFLPRVS